MLSFISIGGSSTVGCPELLLGRTWAARMQGRWWSGTRFQDESAASRLSQACSQRANIWAVRER